VVHYLLGANNFPIRFSPLGILKRSGQLGGILWDSFGKVVGRLVRLGVYWAHSAGGKERKILGGNKIR